MSAGTAREGQQRPASHEADGSRTYTREFFVQTSSDSDDGRTVLSASGLPGIMAKHPSDTALCVKRTPRPVAGTARLWLVTCEYTTKLDKVVAETGGGPGSGQGDFSKDNPLERPPEIEWDTVKYQVALDTDWDGKPIVTAADEPYDPPVVEDAGFLCLTVQVNLPTFNVPQIAKATYAANSDPFLLHDADEILCDMLRAKPGYENETFFVRVTARFVFNPIEYVLIGTPPDQKQVDVAGGWRRRLMHAGFMEVAAATGKRQRIMLPGGQFPSEPWPLHNSGAAFTQAEIAAPQTYPRVYRKFRTKRPFDFNVLNIF